MLSRLHEPSLTGDLPDWQPLRLGSLRRLRLLRKRGEDGLQIRSRVRRAAALVQQCLEAPRQRPGGAQVGRTATDIRRSLHEGPRSLERRSIDTGASMHFGNEVLAHQACSQIRHIQIDLLPIESKCCEGRRGVTETGQRHFGLRRH